MSSKSKKNRDQLLDSTRTAATALVEDLQHVRAVMSRPETSRAELRRLSVMARRLLVNGELVAVAAPRIGKITLNMPDHSPVYELLEKGVSIAHFASGGPTVFGLGFHIMMLNLRKPLPGETPDDVHRRLTGKGLKELEQERLERSQQFVSVRVHNFLAQRVLCIGDLWVTRSDAIKYVANVLGGAHTGEPGSKEEHICALIQKNTTYRLEPDGRVYVHVRRDLGSDSAPFWIDGPPAGAPALKGVDLPPVDPVLIEVLAALRYTADSADVIRLEALIEDELSSA